MQHPLALLKLTTLLPAARGGQVLSLTWHSSEMFPGGAPHMPDEAAVTRFMDKMCAYVDWLGERFALRFLTLDELRRAAEAGELAPGRPGPGRGDWTWPGHAADTGADRQRPDAANPVLSHDGPAGEGRP